MGVQRRTRQIWSRHPHPALPTRGREKRSYSDIFCIERVRQFEIAVDVLHVVMLLQRLHQAHELLAGLVVDHDRRLRLPDQLGGLRLAEFLFERFGDLVERRVGAIDLVAVLARHHIVGAGLDGGVQHGVGIRDLGLEFHQAHMVEHERDRAGFGEVAAALGEIGADVGGGAVAVVGHRLDDQRDAAGAVALVADLIVIIALAADRLVDGALDIVLGHVLGAGRQNGRAQARVHGRVGHPHLRRHRDFAGELGEHLRANRVHPALAVHDILEL